jgi:predicted enzyme related to lactoylglutathione lyase
MRNSVYWVEIPVKDFARAKTFYETIFSIEMPLVEIDRGKYAIFPVDREALGAGGAIVEGTGYEPTPNGAIIYIDRGDADLSIILSRIEPAGGKIVLSKKRNGPKESMGYIAQFIDTEGNRIGLHSMR